MAISFQPTQSLSQTYLFSFFFLYLTVPLPLSLSVSLSISLSLAYCYAISLSLSTFSHTHTLSHTCTNIIKFHNFLMFNDQLLIFYSLVLDRPFYIRHYLLEKKHFFICYVFNMKVQRDPDPTM